MNKKTTIILTQTIIKICYVILAASVIILPLFYNEFPVISKITNMWCIVVPYYCVVPAGYVALFALEKMLKNLRKNIYFDKSNVRVMQVLVYACLYASIVGAVGFAAILIINKFAITMFLILSAGELFMSLICQIVKTLIDSAIEIKEENDLTV